MNEESSQNLGIVMGRLDEQGAAISDLRTDRRHSDDVIREGFASVNSRIDRLFIGVLSIGVAIVALLITLIIRLS